MQFFTKLYVHVQFFDWLTKNKRYLSRKIFVAKIPWRQKYEVHATLTAKTLSHGEKKFQKGTNWHRPALVSLLLSHLYHSAFIFGVSKINNDFENLGYSFTLSCNKRPPQTPVLKREIFTIILPSKHLSSFVYVHRSKKARLCKFSWPIFPPLKWFLPQELFKKFIWNVN